MVLRAGIFGRALVRVPSREVVTSLLDLLVSGLSRLRGEILILEVVVGVAVEAMVVAGESLPLFRLCEEVRLSSISVLKLDSGADSKEELSSCASSDLI